MQMMWGHVGSKFTFQAQSRPISYCSYIFVDTCRSKTRLHAWDASHVVEAFLADSQGMNGTRKLHAKQLIYKTKCSIRFILNENIQYIIQTVSVAYSYVRVACGTYHFAKKHMTIASSCPMVHFSKPFSLQITSNNTCKIALHLSSWSVLGHHATSHAILLQALQLLERWLGSPQVLTWHRVNPVCKVQ